MDESAINFVINIQPYVEHMTVNLLLILFLEKFFFIMKAAADGWRIQYIGANQFRFYVPRCFRENREVLCADTFLKKYRSTHFATNI